MLGSGAVTAFERSADPAETIIAGGRVLSLDPAFPSATAVAIGGGRIVGVGMDAEIEALRGPATEVIDAEGGTVMPGIHDAHSHPSWAGHQLTAATLDYAVLERDRFLERIGRLLQRSAGEEPGGILHVSLWDASSMDVIPTRLDLDELPTSRPILVVAADTHIGLANSRALALAGVASETTDPPGGEIRRAENGEPTGVLLDNAIGLVSELIPRPTAEQDAAAIAAAHERMAKAGITTCLHAAADEAELAALAILADAGRLAVRPHVAIRVEADEAADPAAMLARLEELRHAYGRPGLEIDNVKMFFDGVIEHPTQTAALLSPYRVDVGTEGDPEFAPGGDSGPTYWPPEVARAAITAADAAGWQVHVHAIGDRAARSALDCFEAALVANGPRDNRHTIAHLQLVDPDDFPRFAELGVLANMQMHWAGRDTYTVDRLEEYLGPERYRNVYPAGSLREAGATLCGGSDWPVDPLHPFRQIEMAVSRTAGDAYAGSREPLSAEQGIGLLPSIEMHTRNSAFQLHQESVTGRLVPGMFADLMVVDRDLLEVGLKDVSNASSRLTMLAGRVTHRA